MTRSLLPPKGFMVPTSLYFQMRIAPRFRDTLVQLLMFAWGSPTRTTPPLAYADIAPLMRKGVGTLEEHLTGLRALPAVLQQQPLGDGRFLLTFGEWLFPARLYAARNSGNPELPLKEEEELIKSNDSENHLLPPKAANLEIQKRKSKVRVEPAAPVPPEGSQEAALAERLVKAGVFPRLLAEVFGSGRSTESLGALLDWVTAEKPEAPAALFMTRLRLGAEAPLAFFQAPCPRCGFHSGHSPDCQQRYITGEFGDCVEH